MHHTCVEVDGNDLCPRKERSSPTSCGEGRAELQRQGHRTCPRTPVSAGPARLTGAAPACVSGEGWGLRRCHGCEVSKAVWEGAGRGHGSSGHPSRQRKKTRNREGLDPRAKGEPCPYLRVGVSGKLATGLEFPRGALEASKQLHQVHRPTSAPRLIREERKYVGRQKPELGSPTPLNPGIWMPGDSGSLRLLRQPQPEPGVAGPRGQHGRGGDDSRSCRGPEGEEPMTKSSASTGGGSGQRSYRMVATAELPHGGHSGATAWWTDEEASRARESSPVRKPSGSTCSPGLYLQQGATSRQAQKEKRTAGPGLCAVQARDGTQGVRGQSLSRRQAAQGREGYSTLHVRSSSAGSAPMRGLTFAETCWRDGALASAPKLKEHPLCRTPIPQVSPHQHLPS
ncbi:serine/arginine repetitive matrix protein 3-like isoform X3 [Monodon monoceros]|uniref:serine/arginine repetitive matrix protein 3-like isoform X3 n=1 Tax=Monodon monoceros TaxID=40151 RepID=UPI0010F7C355|nr:serine/arginine repetitive matrix protein 3-like isoform X3 [Monodon monoceros]